MDEQRRKEQAKAYRETARPMGVYRVSVPADGHALVAGSVDLPAILNRHRAQLTMGSHPDAVFQSLWDSLGPDGFVFEVLDTLDPASDLGYDPSDDLAALVTMWKERLAEE